VPTTQRLRNSEKTFKLRLQSTAPKGPPARRVGLIIATLIVNIVAAAVPSVGQTREHPGPLELPQSSIPPVSADQIFAGLAKHNEFQLVRLRNYCALRTYVLTGANGKVHAKEIVRMHYLAPGQKRFVTLEQEGSSLVRHLVFNRLIKSEISAATGQDHRDSSITAANYKLVVLGREDLGHHHCFVVEVLPKRRDKYLFEGTMWIDSSEFAIVKLAGHLAKNPSFWIRHAAFVREYEKIGDFWLPARDETLVDVRLYGRKILTIEHQIYNINGATSADLASRDVRSDGTSRPTRDLYFLREFDANTQSGQFSMPLANLFQDSTSSSTCFSCQRESKIRP
jgi:hypothetical protein